MSSEHPAAGHRARLRQRFLSSPAALSEAEVLELLLTYAIPRRDVAPVAGALMERFGTLNRLLGASPQELTAVPGVGEQAAALVKLVSRMANGSQLDAGEEVEVDHQPPLFDLAAPADPPEEPARPEPVLKTFADDEAANVLHFLPQAEQFPSLEAFQAHLIDRLPYNSASTRRRRARYILARFFPDGSLHTPLTFYAARCASEADLKPVVFYHTLQAELLPRKVAEEFVLPALPLGRINRDGLREFVAASLPDLGPASLEKVLYALFSIYDTLSVGRQDGPNISLQVHPGTFEAFLYVLTAEFPQAGMYSFEQLEQGPMRHWLLWDKAWMHRQLYNLRDLGILSKVSQIDTVRQFTVQVDQTAALKQYFEHPERGRLALRERPAPDYRDERGQS